MTTYFISDLHLDEDRPALTQAFFAFLDEHRDADALYILGDLYDAWIGDDDDRPLAVTTRETLARATRHHPVYVMHGNRDFALGERFGTDTGCTLLPDPSVIDLYGRPALLMHGDTLCTQDTEYMAFRRTVRNPAWLETFLARPLAKRRDMAQALRETSRQAARDKPMDIMDVTPEAVPQVMAEHGVDLLIHGHTHRPAHHRVALPDGAGDRYVLGDWGNEGWAIAADDNGLRLYAFPIPDAGG